MGHACRLLRTGTDCERPAYYAARPGGWRDWWTLLHPPYTAWHLSYAVIGAALAPRVQASRLIATVLAFFLAVGLAAHALDELRGRPLRTRIPSSALVAVVVVGLAGALALGVVGVYRVGWTLIPFMVAGPVLVIAYNAELFGGVMHTDFGFAAAWGAFPVLTGYVAQAGSLAVAPVLAAGGAFALSSAQRRLSTPARNIRRRAVRVEGSITFGDGRIVPITADGLLRPLELALRASSWAIVLLAAGYGRGPADLTDRPGRRGARRAERVVRVGQLAVGQRQAAAADASGQAVPQVLERADPLVEVAAPGRGQPGPVPRGGRPALGQRVQGGLDLGQRDADTLRGADERHPAQHGPRIAPLVAGRPAGGDQTPGLVEVQRGDRRAAARGQLADGDLPCCRVNLCRCGRNLCRCRGKLCHQSDLKVT